LNDEGKAEAPRIGAGALTAYALIFVAAPILTFVIGSSIDRLLGLPEFPPFPLNLVFGFAVFFPGLAVGVKATRLLYRVGQGLPWGEARREASTTRLVTTGLYAYTRNPIVLGYSLLPCGMGLMFRSPGMYLFVPAAVILVNVVIVKTREEPSLERRFGEEYMKYKKSTPMLLPRPGAVLRWIMSLLVGGGKAS
jgi:protein-S-isoprenylcysteine O-methyltransferase Ste14